MNNKKLITIDSSKITKGKSWDNAWPAVSYMSPATESVPYGGVNMCANYGFCAEVCVGNKSGRMVMPKNKAARVNRTLRYLNDRENFLLDYAREIDAHVRRCKRKGYAPAFRPNGATDRRDLGLWVVNYCKKHHPEARVYDYTKLPPKKIDGYHLVYSYSERPEALPTALKYLADGGTVAVCFSVKRHGALPETWNGYPVIDGDKSDARFLDNPGVVVGLRIKGSFKKAANNPFVVLT